MKFEKSSLAAAIHQLQNGCRATSHDSEHADRYTVTTPNDGTFEFAWFWDGGTGLEKEGDLQLLAGMPSELSNQILATDKVGIMLRNLVNLSEMMQGPEAYAQGIGIILKECLSGTQAQAIQNRIMAIPQAVREAMAKIRTAQANGKLPSDAPDNIVLAMACLCQAHSKHPCVIGPMTESAVVQAITMCENSLALCPDLSESEKTSFWLEMAQQLLSDTAVILNQDVMLAQLSVVLDNLEPR